MIESLGWFGVPRLLMRYETLVARPQAALAAIASFIGQPLDPQALTFVQGTSAWLGSHHTVAGNPMRMAAGQISIGLDEAWRSSMPFGQRAQVTALTWPLLRHYAHGADAPPADAESIPAALDPAGGR
jgi:hypothetical protein